MSKDVPSFFSIALEISLSGGEVHPLSGRFQAGERRIGDFRLAIGDVQFPVSAFALRAMEARDLETGGRKNDEVRATNVERGKEKRVLLGAVRSWRETGRFHAKLAKGLFDYEHEDTKT